jgi:hypothetical protein
MGWKVGGDILKAARHFGFLHIVQTQSPTQWTLFGGGGGCSPRSQRGMGMKLNSHLHRMVGTRILVELCLQFPICLNSVPLTQEWGDTAF